MLWAVLELSLNIRIIVQTHVSQTCLEKQNLFLKKRLLPCPVCHCGNWISLTAKSKRYYRKIQRLFCPHPSCQKNSSFPAPESNLILFRRMQTFQDSAMWWRSMLGDTWMLTFLLSHPAPSWLSHLFGYWCLWLAVTSVPAWWVLGCQMKEEHIPGVQACPRIEGGITVTGKAAVLPGELGWGRSKILVSE